MLKIVTVAFVDLAIYSLLDPNDFIDKPLKKCYECENLLVSMLLEELGCKPIFVVDDPNKQKPITLKSIVRNVVKDLLIFQGVVSNCYSSCWVCR